LATNLWCTEDDEALHVIFGDNDGVRFSLIRASAAGDHGQALMQYQLRLEADCGLRTWYARVPTEANISDWPSRNQHHDMLDSFCDVSAKALVEFKKLLQALPGGTLDG